MKFIVIGLGNFGSSLASSLTALGHEVIGVDSSMPRVEAFKDNITSTLCLDCTDLHALATLPLQGADIVVVAIGEDFGASVMVTALLAEKRVKRLISRAVSPLHESVFKALGVKEILHPEKEAAERLVKRIADPGIIESWKIGQEHMVVEVKAPRRYVGSSVVEVDFKGRYQLNLVSILKHHSLEMYSNVPVNPGHASDFVYPGTKIEEQDVLVLFGKKQNIQRFLGE